MNQLGGKKARLTDSGKAKLIAAKLTVGLAQFFARTKVGDEQDISFDASKDMAAMVGEAHKVFGNCVLHLARGEIRFQGFSQPPTGPLAEPVQALVRLFEPYQIGGLRFAPECATPDTLTQNLNRLFHTMAKFEIARSGEIADALSSKGFKAITPIEALELGTTSESLAQEARALAYAIRNALKLILYIQDLRGQKVAGLRLDTRPGYRLAMNLFRTHEKHPKAVAALLRLPVPDPWTGEVFYTTIFWLLLLAKLPLPRETCVHLILESLFLVLLPPKDKPDAEIPPSLALFNGCQPGQGLFGRTVVLECLSKRADPNLIQTVRMLHTVRTFALEWDPNMDEPRCHEKLSAFFSSGETGISQTALVLLGQCLAESFSVPKPG